jgi:hypothetical protein
MIRVVEEKTPWQASLVFPTAFARAIAERLDNELRIQLGAQHELFSVNPGVKVPKLEVNADDLGVTVDAEPPAFQTNSWMDTIRRSVHDQVHEAPLERVKEIVETQDPMASQSTPKQP